jgi:hypothetical protein
VEGATRENFDLGHPTRKGTKPVDGGSSSDRHDIHSIYIHKQRIIVTPQGWDSLPLLVLVHVLLQSPPRRGLGLDQQVFRDVYVEPVRLGSDPGHLELKVSVLVIVVNEMDTGDGMKHDLVNTDLEGKLRMATTRRLTSWQPP